MSFSQDKSEFLLHFFHFRRGSLTREDLRPVLLRLQTNYPIHLSRGQTWFGSLWGLLAQKDLEAVSMSWDEATFAEVLKQVSNELFGSSSLGGEHAPASDFFATGLGQKAFDGLEQSTISDAGSSPHLHAPYGSDVFGTSLGQGAVSHHQQSHPVQAADLFATGQSSSAQNNVTHVPVTQERYVFVRRLAQGGMGEVWEGFDQIEQKTVAIKSVLYQHDANLLARFRSEVRVMRQLQHPHIVRILDDCLDRVPPFFVMELLQGDDISTLMEKRLDAELGGYPLTQTLAIMLQLTGALNHIHEKGLVHRDIKPQNIFLCDDERTVKLLDFGIVREIEATRHTQFGGVVGTPYFMAPEQLAKGSSDKEVGPLADVYACGILMYYLPTGMLSVAGSERLSDVFESLLRDNQIALDECPVDLQEPYLEQARSFAQLQERAVTRALTARCSMVDLQAGLSRIAKKLAEARKHQISRRLEKFEALVQDGHFEESVEFAEKTMASYPEAHSFAERVQEFLEGQRKNNEKIRRIEEQFDLLPLEKIQQIWEQAQAVGKKKNDPLFLHHPFQKKLKQAVSDATSHFRLVKAKAKEAGPKAALALLEKHPIYSDEWSQLQEVLQREVSLFEHCEAIPVDFRKAELLLQDWLDSIQQSKLSTDFFEKNKAAWLKKVQEQERQVQKDNEERCHQSMQQFVRKRSLFVGWSWLGVGGFGGSLLALFYSTLPDGKVRATSVVPWLIGCILFFLVGAVGVLVGELPADEPLGKDGSNPAQALNSSPVLVVGLGCVSLWSFFFFVYCAVVPNMGDTSFFRWITVFSFALMGFVWRPNGQIGASRTAFSETNNGSSSERNRTVMPLVFVCFISLFWFFMPQHYSSFSALSVFAFFSLLGIFVGIFIQFNFSKKRKSFSYVTGYGLLSFAFGVFLVFFAGANLDVLFRLYIRNSLPFGALFAAFGFGAFSLSILLWQKNFSISAFRQDFYDALREERDPAATLVESPRMKRMAFFGSPLLILVGAGVVFMASEGWGTRSLSPMEAAVSPQITTTKSQPPQKKQTHASAASPPTPISCSIPEGDSNYPKIATPIKTEVGDLGVSLSFRDEKGREHWLDTHVRSDIPFGRKSRFVYGAVLEWQGCRPAEMLLRRMEFAESGKKCVPYRHCNRHVKRIIPLDSGAATSVKTNRRIPSTPRSLYSKGYAKNRVAIPQPFLPSTPTRRALEDFEKVYTLILYGSRSAQEALAQQSLFRQRRLGTTVVESRFFSNLRPGWFVLIHGTYQDEKAAISGKKKVEEMGFKGGYYKYTGNYLMRSRLCVVQSGNIILWRDKEFREGTGHFLAHRQCVQRLQTDTSKALKVHRTFWARTSANQKIRLQKSVVLSPERRGIFLYQSQSPVRVRLSKRQRTRYLQQIGFVYLVRTAQGQTGWVDSQWFH